MGTVKTLHIKLECDESDDVEIISFADDPYEYETRKCKLGDIAKLLDGAERDYYTALPAENREIGTKLYNWLDGDERWLASAFKSLEKRNHTILAVETGEQSGGLAHLPWELLHDDKGFLVERNVVPVRWLSKAAEDEAEAAQEDQPKDRALRVLFMASSPLGVEPVLKFELEEQRILETAEAQPLSLIVEESGSLTGLRRICEAHGEGHFDVLHLSGHADLTKEGGRFLTETETGECELVSASDVIEAVENRTPRLIFLSGCHTGRASGATSSMAEAFLNEDGSAVLGWGRAVFDDSAIAASAVLYSKLAAGNTLLQAIASTYRHLIEKKVSDWHLLRLYVPGEKTVVVPGAFITPNAADREPPIYKATTKKFARKQIISPSAFVGRRREIQKCLRLLKDDKAANAGILIHGLGGIGKTALAARLCYSLEPQYQCVVVTGKINEIKLVNALVSRVEDKPELYERLKSKQSLYLRLKQVFAELQEHKNLMLIVLDEFEANLEVRDEKFILSATAREVLKALVDAIQNTDARIQHRLIITSRYRFPFEDLHPLPLSALQAADLIKKLEATLTEKLDSPDFKKECDPDLYKKLSDTLRSQDVQSEILQLSDGNPKLLEVLVEELIKSPEPKEEKERLKTALGELSKSVIGDEEFRAKIAQLDANLQKLLATGLLFTLPVPQSIFDKLGYSDAEFNRAIALGLLEKNFQDELRVPRLLSIDPIKNPETSAQAAQLLYEHWNLKASEPVLGKETEARMLEVYRLTEQANASELILEVTQALVNTYQHRSKFQAAIALCKKTLAVTQDYGVLHRLAQCEAAIGLFEHAEEHYQQALALCPPEDEEKRAFLLYEIATLKVNQNQIEAAKPLLQQAEQLQKRLDNQILKTAIASSWAALYCREGDLPRAFEVCINEVNRQKEALEKAEKCQKGVGEEAEKRQKEAVEEATNLGLGEIFQRLGEIELRLWEKVQRGEIEIESHFSLFLLEQAEVHLRKSLELKGIMGDVHGKSKALFELARLYCAQTHFEKAIESYSYCLGLQEWLGNYRKQAGIWYELAKIYQQQQQFKEALKCCERSLDIHKIHTEFDDPRGEAEVTKLKEKLLNALSEASTKA